MILIRYVFLYIIILSLAIFIAEKFNKKLEKTIPLSFALIIITIYVFGLVNQLLVGVIFTSFISIILLISIIIKNTKNSTIKEMKEKVITPGSIFFTIIFFVFAFVTLNRELTNWDQFSYWSIACKDMFNTNKLNLSIEAVTQYPPVPTVLQYFFMKIIGNYSQGIEIFVTWILGLSFFLPLFEKSNNRKITNIAIAIITIFVPAVFSMIIFYESSYPDALLGIMIGYVSYIYFFEEKSKFKAFNIIMTLIILSLTKGTGVVIALILIATFLLYEILKQNNKKELKNLFIFLTIILITYLSWTIYLRINSSNVNISQNNIHEKSLKEIIYSIKATIITTVEETNDLADSNGKLIEKLYNVTEISTPIKISAGALIFIYIFISLLYYYKVKDKKNTLNIIISIFSGLILYILALQLAYITKFSIKEMLAHDGMERYIASYLLGILYIIVAVCLNEFKSRNRDFPYVLLTCIILMITPINSVANATITSGIYNLNTILYCDMGRNRAEEILKEVEPSQKVLGICQDTNIRLLNLMIRYYMYPTIYKVENKIQEGNKLEDILAKEKYDYIYIISTDEYLNTKLNELLNIQKVEKDKLYKIENINVNL